LEEILPTALRNRNPGIECAYIAAEEVLVAAGYDEFKGWGTTVPNGGRGYGREMAYILAALDERGIEYYSTRNGDTSIFDKARQAKVAVYVQVPGHAYTVLVLTKRYAYIVNNFTAPGPQFNTQAEEQSKKVYRVERSYFLRQRWEGIAWCLKCRRKKKDPPVAPAPVPVQPGPLNPTPPVGPPGPVVAPPPAEKPPAAPCNCPPPQKVDLGPVLDGMAKLTEANVATAKAVGDLAGKIGTIDARLVTVEGKLADAAKLPPPSTVTPDQIAKAVKDEMAKLRQSLRQSGTLRISVTPK
jgi:hypothetical protein